MGKGNSKFMTTFLKNSREVKAENPGVNPRTSNEVRPRTGNQTLVKELNKSIILNLVWRHAPISRAAIAKMSGLNRATVSSLVDELIGESYVKEIGTGDSAVGRKPIMLQFNPEAGVILGVDLGVNYILILLTDLTANILVRKRLVIDPGSGEKRILGKMMDAMAEVLAQSPPTPKGLLGIGVGVPGLVEMEHGVLAFAPNLRWKNVPLREILQGRFGVPVYVDNEANVGALGEKWFGAGQGVRDMVYLSVGVGLGAGIVINGELYRGATGYAGELGHFTIMPDGPQCGCGNRGCWETLASEGATLKRAIKAVKEAVERGEDTVLRDIVLRGMAQEDAGEIARGESGETLCEGLEEVGHAGSEEKAEEGARLSIELLVEACEQGDRVAQDVLRETGRYLGIGMAGVINAYNPEVVIIGNTIGRCGNWVLEEASKEVEARGLSQLIRGVKVVPAALGPDACAMGGVSLVLSDFLSLPRIAF